MRGHERSGWLRGAAAGAAGGLVASYGMTLLLRALDHLGLDAEHHPQHSVNRGDRDSTAATQPGSQEDDATVEAVERAAGALGWQLSERQKQLAGPLAHYTFGATMAALYGALAAKHERVTAGYGLAFGMLVWLLFDEIAIPALKLSPPPWKSPASVHARGVAAHVVYGPGTELVRRALC